MRKDENATLMNGVVTTEIAFQFIIDVITIYTTSGQTVQMGVTKARKLVVGQGSRFIATMNCFLFGPNR